MDTDLIEKIAVVCHEANRAWCVLHGDYSLEPWPMAPDWQKASIRLGVKFCLDNPNAPSSANHDAWMAHKRAEGWVYGMVKSNDARTHPCLVPYEELPPEQRAKDALIKAIVKALS